MKIDTEQQKAPKREWSRPELHRLEAGAAESSHGNAPDGGGGNQGS
ncbi:MAG: hypothetical protein QOE79_1395 [Sphingomonadales bacterium]|jgi:hypothetical protein|nr:hypothetical protein [Sphingomonadales bacterium]